MRGIIVIISVFWSVFAFGQEVKLGLPVGHPFYSDFEVSANRLYILTTGYDAKSVHSTCLWSVKDNKLINTFHGDTISPDKVVGINSAKFILNDSIILFINENWTVTLRSLLGVKQTKLKGHKGSIFFAKVSPDGKMILTVS